MLILGVETTCDETSLAIVEDGKKVHFNESITQVAKHNLFGGVVPEIASRSHYQSLFVLSDLLEKKSKIKIKDIDAIAVCNEPGLIGALLLGVTFAKTLCFIFNKPLIAVNHLYAHIAAASLENEVEYPTLGILVSGGHTVFFKVENEITFKVLGKTYDDAAGECFDKVAKMLKLPYPGGPAIDKLVSQAEKKEFVNLNFNWQNKWGPNLSFSGLKTAVLYYIHGQNMKTPKILSPQEIVNIAYTIQEIITDMIAQKTKDLIEKYDFKSIVLAGGVAANSVLREKIKAMKTSHLKVAIPSIKYCLDNGAMVATMGYFLAKNNIYSSLKIDCNSIFV
jgi:N6-L-threonylcarbamoyladenine synthase